MNALISSLTTILVFVGVVTFIAKRHKSRKNAEQLWVDDHRQAILALVANELSERVGRSADDIRKNGLTAYDFSPDEKVEVTFEDGSTLRFNYAFFVSCPERGKVAVFTEHCGYYLFSILGTSIIQKEVKWDLN